MLYYIIVSYCILYTLYKVLYNKIMATEDQVRIKNFNRILIENLQTY